MAAAVAAPALAGISGIRPSFPSPIVHRRQQPKNPSLNYGFPRTRPELPGTIRAATAVVFEEKHTNPNACIQRLCQLGDLREAVRSLSGPNFPISDLDSTTLCSVLQLCAEAGSLRGGRIVQSIMNSSRIEIDAALGSKLVFMYVRCGDLREGRRVFDVLGSKDRPFLWNLLASEYAKAGDFRESIALFQLMLASGTNPDSRTFSCILKCFAGIGSVHGGEQVHGCLLKLGFEEYVAVGNALIAFYSKCGRIDIAIDLFDGMPERDVISWNSVINACVSNGLSRKALELLREMWLAGVSLDLATLVSVIPACAELGTTLLSIGRAIHGYSVKAGFRSEITLSNSILDMYSKCGVLNDAVQVFCKMGERSIVSWTSMISGYTRNGRYQEAIALFEQMESEDIKPDLFVISSVLHACACSGSLDRGKYVHEYVTRNGMGSKLFVSNALIDMYAKCGCMEAARSMFDHATRKDIVSWNTLIGGYSKNCLPNEALKLFHDMQLYVKPNSVTMACVLPACVSLSTLQKGREIHGQILRARYLADGHVTNALVDMYAKCGALAHARLLFDQMITKDLISWTVMIAGYGMHGYGREAIAIFKKMRQRDVEPDEVSFIAILYACSHSGLIDEGWRFFNYMRNEYKIEPKLEHYACMVDLLSRTGHLTKAYKFIRSMPIEPDATVWSALLCGCRIHRDVKLAERVAEEVFKLEPENTGYYVLLANIYAEAAKWEGVKKIRARISGRGLQMNPGCSWIEIKRKVHVFVVVDKSHPQSKDIEIFLENVRRQMEDAGSSPNKRYALINADDTAKEEALCGHSEKLAIAFGILNLANGKPVRITKNLRICGDCHEVAKFISKMVDREIILRDSNRFHHFEEGKCSCRDYW